MLPHRRMKVVGIIATHDWYVRHNPYKKKKKEIKKYLLPLFIPFQAVHTPSMALQRHQSTIL